MDSTKDFGIIWKAADDSSGSVIRVHGFLLRQRAPKIWTEKTLLCSYAAQETFIEYLYSDFACEIQNRNEKVIEEVLQLSTTLNIPRLTWLCQTTLVALRKEDILDTTPPGSLTGDLVNSLAQLKGDSGVELIELEVSPNQPVVAHKSILAARSSYFHGMLLSGFKESSSYIPSPSNSSSAEASAKSQRLDLTSLVEEFGLSEHLLRHIVHIIYTDQLNETMLSDISELSHLIHLLDYFCVWSTGAAACRLLRSVFRLTCILGIAHSVIKFVHTSKILQDVTNWLSVYKLCRMHKGMEMLKGFTLDLFQKNRKKAHPVLLKEKDQSVINEILLHVLFACD